MKFVSKCQCGATSGMHPHQEKVDGRPVTVLRGSCVICGKELKEEDGHYMAGPRGVEEPEVDLLEIL